MAASGCSCGLSALENDHSDGAVRLAGPVHGDIVDLDVEGKRLAGREDLDLATHPDLSIGRIKADPGQIEQVIMNLVVNAREAMPGGGQLTLETAEAKLDEDYCRKRPGTRPGTYVMMAVTDTGEGMSEEVRSRVFEPFFTTRDQGKGTGLGLSTVYGIVKQSGGDIRVYSEPGRGTTFKIYLPRHEGPADAMPERRAVPERLRGEETILVVEDEDTLRRLVARILKRHGYEVLAASNGGEALLICEQREGAIHLMLTDVVMPQMSGPELADRLRDVVPDMRVLFMSGYTDNAMVHQGLIDRDVQFLQKPFTAEAVAAKVRSVLDT